VCQCAMSVDRECSKGSRGSVFSFFSCSDCEKSGDLLLSPDNR
jgi:hypothetical protein